MSNYNSSCVQSSTALLGISIGIMAIIFIAELSPQFMIIIHILLLIVIWPLVGTTIFSQYKLYQSTNDGELFHFISLSLGTLLLGIIAGLLTVYSLNVKIGVL